VVVDSLPFYSPIFNLSTQMQYEIVPIDVRGMGGVCLRLPPYVCPGASAPLPAKTPRTRS
jgi:hypothetical protein